VSNYVTGWRHKGLRLKFMAFHSDTFSAPRLAFRSLLGADRGEYRLYPVPELTESDAADAFARMVHDPFGATALICASSEVSVGVLERMAADGLKSPEDLSVVHLRGGTPVDRMPDEPTMLEIDFLQEGRLMAEQALWMLDHPGHIQPALTVPMPLTVGRTTGAPASR